MLMLITLLGITLSTAVFKDYNGKVSKDVVTETMGSGKYVCLNNPLFEDEFDVMQATRSGVSNALTICQPNSSSVKVICEVNNNSSLPPK